MTGNCAFIECMKGRWHIQLWFIQRSPDKLQTRERAQSHKTYSERLLSLQATEEGQGFPWQEQSSSAAAMSLCNWLTGSVSVASPGQQMLPQIHTPSPLLFAVDIITRKSWHLGISKLNFKKKKNFQGRSRQVPRQLRTNLLGLGTT